MESSVFRRKINILLLAIPLVLFSASILRTLEAGSGIAWAENITDLLIFALAGLALIPLAGFVESAVEELAELLGPFVGGLLHTTFGNLAELTIALSLLLAFPAGAASELVMGSIAGVIIRNSLLFLGVSTLFGAWRNGRMKFNSENASEYSTVFALAIVGVSIPTIATMVLPRVADASALKVPIHIPLNGFLAVVLVVNYIAYIGFAVTPRRGEEYHLAERRSKLRAIRPGPRRLRRGQLGPADSLLARTDTQDLFRAERQQAEARLEASSLGAAGGTASARGEHSSAAASRGERRRIYARAALAEERRRKAREEHAGHLAWRAWRGVIAALVLGIATSGIATMSGAFAKAVESLTSRNVGLHQYEFFLGLILIPLLAGVVELYGSVWAARVNRMEITMAVTAGATIQMILLVVPILVLVGLNTGHPLALVFKPIEIIIVGVATVMFIQLSRDGELTWLKGMQLCGLWALVACATLFLPPHLTLTP